MEILQLKKHLTYLIEKYIVHDEDKKYLLKKINKQGEPKVKYFLAELDKLGKQIEEKDSSVIKEIVFYFV